MHPPNIQLSIEPHNQPHNPRQLLLNHITAVQPKPTSNPPYQRHHVCNVPNYVFPTVCPSPGSGDGPSRGMTPPPGLAGSPSSAGTGAPHAQAPWPYSRHQHAEAAARHLPPAAHRVQEVALHLLQWLVCTKSCGGCEGSVVACGMVQGGEWGEMSKVRGSRPASAALAGVHTD